MSVSGCAARFERAPFVTNVVWPEGPPEGEFENDPLVIQIRNYRALLAASINSLDFSQPEYVNAVDRMFRASGYSNVDLFETKLLQPGQRYPPLLGPLPFSVTNVEYDPPRTESYVKKSDEGTPVVTLCAAIAEPKRNRIAPSYGPSGPYFTVMYVHFSKQADSSLRIRRMFTYGLYCKPKNVKYGFFDPAPPSDEAYDNAEESDLIVVSRKPK